MNNTIASLAPKPFLKWAGGKGQLIPQIEPLLPKELTLTGKIKNYLEPFLGGGAVYFWLSSQFEFEDVFLYEFNKDVADCYQTIKTRANPLIMELEELEKEYLCKNEQRREEFYYEKRVEFNRLSGPKSRNHVLRKSALLIFLNKTCYNGLYRVNASGEFNVPFGRYRNPTICDEQNIHAVKSALKNAEIIQGDFAVCLEHANSKSFVYFDPPYRPLSETSSFTSYSQGNFSDSEQIRLKEVFDKLDKRGAYVMLSNSDPKNYDPNDNYFDDLYSKHRIERLKAARMINCDAQKRGEIKEILVMNY